MNTAIVLAMHGVPPSDAPRDDVMELFRLHSMIEARPQSVDDKTKQRHEALDSKVREWPRNEDNDPYWSASYRLAKKLEEESGHRVYVGFNEFCAPTIDSAIESAIAKGAKKVVVITTMMTKGGEHSEVDIPEAIGRAKTKFPEVEFIYAWPFDEESVASFLTQHLRRYIS